MSNDYRHHQNFLGYMINFTIDKNIFQEKLFEKNVLHMQACFDTNFYGWDSFGRDFFTIEPALGTVRLYRGGRLERQTYQQAMPQDNEIGYKFNKLVFNEILNNGGSMVVNRFDKSSKFVADLCREFADFSGYAAVGNAYATKGGTGTFGKHWDAHCVFATQLIGAKHWTVYRPTVDLPLGAHTGFERPASSVSEMVFDGIVAAGDVIYIPRGWWHEVKPIAGQPSLHISVGIHTPKVIDYLKWMLANKMSSHIEFRESLSLSSFSVKEMARAGDLIIEKSINRQSFEEYLNALKTAISDKPYVDFEDIFK